MIRKSGWRGKNKGKPCEFGTPCNSNMVIEFKKTEQFTSGGIALPDEVVNKESNAAMTATVLAIGVDCWLDQPSDGCDIGDTVILARYSGTKMDNVPEGRDVRFCSDMQILGVKN